MMLFGDTYKTIAEPSEGVFRDRGSKFIAYAFPAISEAEAKSKLAEIKALHPKARHHCWALRLSPDRSVFRLNDDGEPSGSAGRSILNTLLSFDVTNIVLIVVRYFGGSLLGIPGLINAYKSAAEEALKAAHIIEKTINDYYSVSFDYPMMNEVMRIVKEENLQVISQKYDNPCEMEISVKQTQLDMVLGKLQKIESINLNYLRTI